MRSLVTGVSGFTGVALTRRLEREPQMEIFGADIRQPEGLPLAKAFVADLADRARVRQMLEESKPNWIFHLAGRLKGNASDLFQANTQNTVHLLEAASEVVPEARVLLIGSAAEYGFRREWDGVPISESEHCSPQGAYGLSKYAMTLAGLDFNRRTKLSVNIARSFNLIGPNIPNTLLLGALIQRVQEAQTKGESKIKVGNVSAERDFIDVRDAVEAYVTIMLSEARGEIFNVCAGSATKIQTLVEAALALAPAGMTYEVDQTLLRPDDPKRIIGNGAKLKALGFEPALTVAESLRDACLAFAPKTK